MKWKTLFVCAFKKLTAIFFRLHGYYVCNFDHKHTFSTCGMKQTHGCK